MEPEVTYQDFASRLRYRSIGSSYADERAWLLLYNHLTEEQRRQMVEYGSFDVVGDDGGGYRLFEAGSIARIGLHRDDKRQGDYFYCCGVIPADPYTGEREGVPLPYGDQVLAKKLLVESSIEEFVDRAY